MQYPQDTPEHNHAPERCPPTPVPEPSDNDMRPAARKLWQTATYAVAAVAIERGWQHATHRDMINVVQRLAAEQDDTLLYAQFCAAGKFQMGMYIDMLEPYEVEMDAPIVYDFVERMRALLQSEKRTQETQEA